MDDNTNTPLQPTPEPQPTTPADAPEPQTEQAETPVSSDPVANDPALQTTEDTQQDNTGDQNSTKPKAPNSKVVLIAIGALLCVLSITALGWFGYNKFVNNSGSQSEESDSMSFDQSPSPDVAGTKDQASTDEAKLQTQATPEAQPSPTGDNCQTYTKNGFSICQPPTWSKDESGAAGTTVIFKNPKTDKDGTTSYTANLNVLVKPSENDLAGYIADAKDYMPKLFQNYALIHEEQIDLNGKKAHTLEATYISTNAKVHVKQIILVEDSKVYLITSASLDSAWNNYISSFNSQVQTFKII